ncbi:alkaline phosphatase [Leptodesmis sp.]|uniref:alkaline phosphatase n=1 Tax=Leptodesmis sp. TaxID=3100501 RepID=UPI0040535009
MKSHNNAIGVDIYEQPLETIMVTAALNGKSTGLVSSSPIDHATPGAAAAVNRRAKYDSEFPNLDSILQQELRIYQPTVLLGGGHPLSNTQTPLPAGVEPPSIFEFITKDIYEYLRSNPTDNRYGYTFLERGPDAARILAETAANLDPNAGDRLVGLYGARGQNGNLPVSLANGDYSTTGLDMFSLFSSQGLKPDTQRPLLPGETDASFIARKVNENPTLKDLSLAALSTLGKDPDGFWLMIEGEDIDWAAHDNNLDNLIGTVLDFDKTIGAVIDWINNNGGWEENLLIVTADHNHYLTLNPNYPSLLRTAGAEAMTSALTPDLAGQFWGSNPTVKYGWGNHSNRPVPVYYQGAGSEVLSSYVGQGYYIFANRGNNTVYSGAGDDLIYASFGNDVIAAGAGDNTIFAGAGDNTIYTGAGADYISTGSGKDLIFAGDGDNVIVSGAGDDRIIAGSGKNMIDAGLGNDVVYVGSGENRFTLNAGTGSVAIYGFTDDDAIRQGVGLTASGTTPAPQLTYKISGSDTLISLGDDLLATLKDVLLEVVPIAGENK